MQKTKVDPEKLRRYHSIKEPPQQKKRTIQPEDIIEFRHRFMLVYGWIPLSEWKKIKFPEFWDLAAKVDEHLEMEEEKRLQLHETIIRAITGKKPRRTKKNGR
jgi:hypothetical protein